VNTSRASKVIALSLGGALTAVVGLLSTMVLARVLTKSDYATYRQTMLAYQFAEPLLTLALPMALYYFLPLSSNRERGVLLDNIALLTLLASVFTLFLFFGGNNLLALRFDNPALSSSLRWLIPYPLFVMPASIVSAVMVVKGRTTLLSVYNVTSRLLLGVLVIGSSLVWRNHLAPVISQVVWAGVMLPIALTMAFSSVSKGASGLRLTMMLSMIKYSVPLGLSTMLGTVTLQLDKMIVSLLCSPEEFAVYANGAVEIPLVGVITGSIAAVILADMTVACRNGSYTEALELFRKAAIRSGMILLPISVFLFLHARDFILILFSAKYSGSVLPFRIFLFILPVRIVFFGSALMALGMTSSIMWRSAGSLVLNSVLCYLFVTWFGYIGAAVALVLTIYLWSVPYNLRLIAMGFTCRYTSVLPVRQLLSIFLVGLVAGLLSCIRFLLPLDWPIASFGVALLVFGSAYVMIATYVFPEWMSYGKALLKHHLRPRAGAVTSRA